MATYAVAAFACDASMTLMLPATFGGVTLVHVRPPSRVTCTNRVLVPVHMTFSFTGDGASAVIEPPTAGAPTPPPADSASGLGAAARTRAAAHRRSGRLPWADTARRPVPSCDRTGAAHDTTLE